ncbi:MAG: hypothetical protein RL662_1252 [Bacteroidota bacterium]
MNKLKLVFSMVLALSIFSGCSSDAPVMPSVEPEAKLYDVTFDVSNFSTDVSDIRSTANQALPHLLYRLYASTATGGAGSVMSSGRLTNAGAIPKINLKLTSGYYVIDVFSSQDSIIELQNQGQFPSGSPILQYWNLKNELFSGRLHFQVDGNSLAKSMKLTRPIGRVNLKIKDLDKVPASVTHIIPVFYSRVYGIVDAPIPYDVFPIYTYGIYYNNKSLFDVSAPKNVCYNSIAIAKKDIALYNENNPIQFNFPRTDSYATINNPVNTFNLYLIGIKSETLDDASFSFYNANFVFGKLLKKDIQILPNQSITLSGSIFNDEEALGFEVNDAWGETIDKEF